MLDRHNSIHWGTPEVFLLKLALLDVLNYNPTEFNFAFHRLDRWRTNIILSMETIPSLFLYFTSFYLLLPPPTFSSILSPSLLNISRVVRLEERWVFTGIKLTKIWHHECKPMLPLSKWVFKARHKCMHRVWKENLTVRYIFIYMRVRSS